MVYCRPASQFCCGCSIGFGVKTVLFLHLATVCAILGMNIRQTFFPHGPWLGPNTMTVNFAWFGFFLAGLPIILAALWSAHTRTEAFLWLYFYYFVLTIILDTVVLVQAFLLAGDPCANFSEIFRVGDAFACGIARASNVGLVVLAEAVQGYALHVVWSYLEDLLVSGPELSDLMIDESALLMKRHKEDPLFSIVGYAEHVPEDYGSVYDIAADGGLGGSSRIFNGMRHEMSYPPPKGYTGPAMSLVS